MSESDLAGTRRSLRESRSRGRWRFLLDLLIILLIACCVSFLMKTFVVRSFFIPSGSMENTLQVNDRILVDQLTPLWKDLERGEVVVFKDPGGWLPVSPQRPAQSGIVEGTRQLLIAIGFLASDSDDHLVKRIIGLPGDTVACCNSLGQLTVNGAPIDEAAYLKLPAGETRASDTSFEVTVPSGALWVLGDNRMRSQDSRAHAAQPGGGFVPIGNVVGRAFLKTWPLSNIGILDSHSVLFNGVPEAE